MTLNFPSQEDFFYKGKWDEGNVDFFIDFLVKDLSRHPEERGACIPVGALHRGWSAVNKRYGLHFSWDEICDQFNMLKDRYNTFTEIIRTPGVDWVEPLCHVHAPEELWRRIWEQNNLAKAYYFVGDANYEELRQIFNDTCVEASSSQRLSGGITTEEDEVLNPRTSIRNPRRRLFEESIPLDPRITNKRSAPRPYLLGIEGPNDAR